jgi:hypothetical protein
MSGSDSVVGWQIRHQERLKYHTTGSPTFYIRFYTYPPYRQHIDLVQPPKHCSLKIKKLNSFFLYNKKVRSRGSINFDRTLNVEPIETYFSPHTDWGKISSISHDLKVKYRESSKYWPLASEDLSKVEAMDWFQTDDLNHWVQEVSSFISATITSRENQEDRLGAQRALINGIGDCDEFTDLLITLARLKGIPSRRLTGYFIRDGGKVVEPHAWADLFSPIHDWIPIDLALANIGAHTKNYVVKKVEEFNPTLPDYQVQARHSSTVSHQWIRSLPEISQIHYKVKK